MKPLPSACRPIWRLLGLLATLLCAACAHCPPAISVQPVLPSPDPILLERAPTDQIERMQAILERMRSGKPAAPASAP